MLPVHVILRNYYNNILKSADDIKDSSVLLGYSFRFDFTPYIDADIDRVILLIGDTQKVFKRPFDIKFELVLDSYTRWKDVVITTKDVNSDISSSFNYLPASLAGLLDRCITETPIDRFY
jgi:hypothetical protein